MAEHAFFPPQPMRASYSNGMVSLETEDDFLQNQASQSYLLDELRDSAKLKADILSHPLYEQLLQAHVSCLCVGLPADYIKALEAQLASKHNVAIKYLMLGRDAVPEVDASTEMDHFMESYLLLLHAFKTQLEEHVLPPTNKAMIAYSELEQAFRELTERSCLEIPDTTASDTEFEGGDDDYANGELYEEVDGLKVMQNETDRSLLEHVRNELKVELKEGYIQNITAVREEIWRKRRAGKLPGDTTVLKRWWNEHCKWPYPTEDEKQKMVQETGLELRQINNWFINHRKRNWSGKNIPL